MYVMNNPRKHTRIQTIKIIIHVGNGSEIWQAHLGGMDGKSGGGDVQDRVQALPL